MLKGKSILVAMFLLALFAVSAVSAADNATEDISDMGETLSDEVISVEEIQATGQANDGETIGETDDGTFTVLQQKINNACINATITLSNNYTYDEGFSFDGISITKDLTIDGQGYTIDGNNKARIFKVENGHNVVFRNITFINGWATDEDGGAIYGNEGVTAVNCTFTNNNVYEDGGAMYGGSAVNCTFTNNLALGYGGAMFGGSAVNCTFNFNSAPSPDGGGVMYYGSAVNCTFNNNTGSAMYNGSAVNCTFNNNTGFNSGAMFGGSAVNCTFTNNTADVGGAMREGSAVNCDFTGNKADREGGAMEGGSEDTCVFKDNTPDDYSSTKVFGPSLSVENYTSYYNSGDKLLFNLSTHSGMRVTNRNITIKISTIDGEDVGTFYSLSDGWVVPLGVGEYRASCKATDFDMEPVNATLKITQSNVTLNASYNILALDDGFAVNITVNTDPAINGNLTITFNGNEYPVGVVNGTANFTSDKVYSGNYSTEVFYAGSDIYFNSSTEITAVVKSANVTMLGTFTHYYYNDDMGSDSEKGISKVQVVDADGNPIKNGVVTISFMDMYRLKVKTDSDGVAEFTKAFKPGTYTVSVQYDNKTTKLGNLVLKSVVNLPKLSKVSKSAKSTTIKITLKGTGPIKGKTVIVTFMKKQYTIKTDKNGVAQFKVTQSMVSKLGVGKTYKIRATYKMDSVAQGIQILK